jgi:hypothetical protein
MHLSIEGVKVKIKFTGKLLVIFPLQVDSIGVSIKPIILEKKSLLLDFVNIVLPYTQGFV